MNDLQRENERLRSLLLHVEWSATTRGPGTNMGWSDGALLQSCPICHGVKDTPQAHGNFIPEAIGHKVFCPIRDIVAPRPEGSQ